MCDNLVNNSISGQMKSKLNLLSNLKAFDNNLCKRVTQLNANYVSLNSHELNDKSIELINCINLLKINGNNKRFTYKSHLNRHKSAVHLKLKRFICDVNGCGQRFSQKSDLNRQNHTFGKKALHMQ